MTPEIDFAKARREGIRWVILIALYNARPIRASEELLLNVLQGIYTDITLQEARRELSYVEGMSFVLVTRLPNGKWFACLTHRGVDVVEYNAERPIGISRPEKYWS